MSGRRFVSAAWLMSVCVLFGCASGPSRNFFSRRAKPTTSEDEFVNRLMADAKRMEKKGDRASANNLREEANSIAASSATFQDSDETAAVSKTAAASKGRSIELPDEAADQPAVEAAQTKKSPTKSKFSLEDDAGATARLQLDGGSDDFTQSLREPPMKRLGGGQFGVSSRTPIEAPAPKRRSDYIQNSIDAAGPGQFQAPPDARELTPVDSSSDQSREFSNAFNSVASSPSPFGNQSEPDVGSNGNYDVISADYQTDNQPFDNANSGVVQAGASERSASGLQDPTNPWSQFRGLTKRGESMPMESRRNESRSFAPTSDQVTPNNNAALPQQWPGHSSSPGAFAPQANNQNSASSNWQNNDSQNNNGSSPELWPRAPGANRFTQSNDNMASNAQGWTDSTPVGANAIQNNVQPIGNVQSANSIPVVENAQSPFAPTTIPGFNFPPQQSPTTSALLTDSPASNADLFPLPNGAPSTIAPFTSSPDLDRLIIQTSAEAAAMVPGENEIERQAYLRKHVQLRLLHLIAGQMDRALQPVPNVDAADQEFWQQMLWGIANYFDMQGMPDSDERATQTIAQLRSAASRLQEKARLELHNVAFCHKITSFGNYQRFKRDEFTPGQPVLLYAEVSSFKSEPTSDGQFRTLMKSSVEVFEGGIQGRMIESIPFAPSEDRCRNHRRDYFHSYEFAIPQGISSGPHVLRLTVEDQLGKKTAVTTLNFTVQ